ncbi:MAG: tetratricopeptide repeat protein [Bacteroidetes bacterium]|nr:tetratricopeptide repeat protein [Bacteroidota bacterium]
MQDCRKQNHYQPFLSLAALLSMLLLSSSTLAREKFNFSVKDIVKQPADNRLNYFFTMHYTWQKEKQDLKRVDSLLRIAEELNDSQLLEYAQVVKYAFNLFLTPSQVKKDAIFKAAEEYISQSDNKELTPFFYYTIGIYAFYTGDLKKGLPLVYEAKQLLETLHYESFRHASFYYLGFFHLYYTFQDYPKAAQYCELALQNKHDFMFFPADYYNNAGLCYFNLKAYEKAEIYFRKAIEDAKKRKEKIIEGIAIGNLGQTYWLKGQYQKALTYLYQGLKTNEKNIQNIPLNAANTRMYIAHCLLSLDSLEKAKQFMQTYSSQDPFWSLSYNRMRLTTLSLYYDKTKNYALASAYKDSLMILKDSIKVRTDSNKIKVFESQLEAEKFLNEKRDLEAKAQNEKQKRNLIIAGLILFFGTGLVWLNERRKQAKKLGDQKRQQAEEMLAQANRQLEQYIANIKDKNALIEKISFQLQVANRTNSLSAEEADKYIKNLQQSVILTEENWLEFKALFEKVFPNFFSDLGQYYDDLNPSEVRLLALQRLELPTKDMANMLGISTDSIKKARYRLRKKYPDLLES